MGKRSIVFQKFETHDKIVSIQIVSTTPKTLWVFQLKVINEWSTLKKNMKGRNQPKAIQDTHISVTFSAKYDAKWFCCADTKEQNSDTNEACYV